MAKLSCTTLLLISIICLSVAAIVVARPAKINYNSGRKCQIIWTLPEERCEEECRDICINDFHGEQHCSEFVPGTKISQCTCLVDC
ncbi:hypothetical protein MKX03_032314 [Papaver bracteatum]|nr:hypothetical protein MKX03_032314 [Papaver bracteatum]